MSYPYMHQLHMQALLVAATTLSALLAIPVPTAAQSSGNDKNVLNSLYNSTYGSYWDDKTNWNSSNPWACGMA